MPLLHALFCLPSGGFCIICSDCQLLIHTSLPFSFFLFSAPLFFMLPLFLSSGLSPLSDLSFSFFHFAQPLFLSIVIKAETLLVPLATPPKSLRPPSVHLPTISRTIAYVMEKHGCRGTCHRLKGQSPWREYQHLLNC